MSLKHNLKNRAGESLARELNIQDSWRPGLPYAKGRGYKRDKELDCVSRVMGSHGGCVRQRGMWLDPMMEGSIWTSMGAILEAEADV